MWTFPKVRGTRTWCRQRGESSQWSSNYPQTYRIVSAWDIQWNPEEIKAMWDCASQLWVLGRSRVHGRPFLDFCPITLRHYSFRYWWVRRWMQNSKRSRMVPFFVWWGHWRGVWGVGSPSGMSTPKSIRPKKTPSCISHKKNSSQKCTAAVYSSVPLFLFYSYSCICLNSSFTAKTPYVLFYSLRDFINQSDAVGVADFADKCLALFDHWPCLFFLVSCSVWPPSLLEAAFFFCYSSTALAGGYSCVTLTPYNDMNFSQPASPALLCSFCSGISQPTAGSLCYLSSTYVQAPQKNRFRAQTEWNVV